MSKREKRLRKAWKRVTVTELDAAEAYLDWCRVVLGLPHWKIYVGHDGPCPDDAYADCDVNPTRYMAKVRLCREWTTASRWAQSNALLHEALHVSHHMLTESVDTHLATGTLKKHEPTFRVIESLVNLQAERMVDQLATALCDALDAEAAWIRIRSAHNL